MSITPRHAYALSPPPLDDKQVRPATGVQSRVLPSPRKCSSTWSCRPWAPRCAPTACLLAPAALTAASCAGWPNRARASPRRRWLAGAALGRQRRLRPPGLHHRCARRAELAALAAACPFSPSPKALVLTPSFDALQATTRRASCRSACAPPRQTRPLTQTRCVASATPRCRIERQTPRVDRSCTALPAPGASPARQRRRHAARRLLNRPRRAPLLPFVPSKPR